MANVLIRFDNSDDLDIFIEQLQQIDWQNEKIKQAVENCEKNAKEIDRFALFIDGVLIKQGSRKEIYDLYKVESSRQGNTTMREKKGDKWIVVFKKQMNA